VSIIIGIVLAHKPWRVRRKNWKIARAASTTRGTPLVVEDDPNGR
jgi:hypothetical protein